MSSGFTDSVHCLLKMTFDNCSLGFFFTRRNEEIEMLKKTVFFLFSQITMLINNAGVVSGRALLDTPDDLIERSFNVNVLAHFWVCIPISDFMIIYPNTLEYIKTFLFLYFSSLNFDLDNKNIFASHA